MKKVLLLLTCFIMLSITGCASMPKKSDYTLLETAPQIEANEQSALIYFFREKSFIGAGVSYYVNENGERIGVIRNGSYFVLNAPTGQHTYSAETESTVTVTINVEAGKNYYIEGGVGMGMFMGRPTLNIVTEDYAKPKLNGLDYIVFNK